MIKRNDMVLSNGQIIDLHSFCNVFPRVSIYSYTQNAFYKCMHAVYYILHRMHVLAYVCIFKCKEIAIQYHNDKQKFILQVH